MCVVSMVMDHFQPLVPEPVVTQQWWSGVNDAQMAQRIEDLRKLIADFKEAVEAAKKIDLLTGQSDCVDPEKAKLEARVAELEQMLFKPYWVIKRRGDEQYLSSFTTGWARRRRDATRYTSYNDASIALSFLFSDAFIVKVVRRCKK